MKNRLLCASLMGVATLVASIANANTTLPLNRPLAEPIAIVGAYDISQNPARILGDATISKSNKDHRLCWRIENVRPNTTYQVLEHILSPDVASFMDRDGQNGRSPSGRYHRITRSLLTDDNGAFQKCWQFDQTDPNGEYQIQVEVGDLQFPVRFFYVAD